MTDPASPTGQPIGRYVLHDRIASGGMASVHLGSLRVPGGFSRMVAIKRLHAQYAQDPEFVSMFLDEAHLAARIRHPNVVATLDVVALDGELFLVMDYVHGESLGRVQKEVVSRGELVEPAIAVAVAAGALHGLHAAHTARDDHGEDLHIVHRDVSPQNILVGGDGIARLVDFGVAKAVGRLQTTREGQVKGKASYMAPEQIAARRVDRRVDVFAMGVVVWEMLVGRQLFRGESPAETMARVLALNVPRPSEVRAGIPPALDAVILRSLAEDPEARFATAREMAIALEVALPPATARQVGDWALEMAGDELDRRARRIAEIERDVAVDRTQVVKALMGTTGTMEAVTLAQQSPAHSPTARGVWVKRAIAGVILGALLGGGIFTARVATRPRAPGATEAAPRPPDPSVAGASVSSAPVALSSEASTSSDSAEAVQAPAVSGAKQAPTPRSWKRAPSSSSSRQRGSCDPPFTMDADGIRVPKPQCL